MNKWKNYGLWVSIFSLVGIILQNTGLLAKIGLTGDAWNIFINSLLGLLVMLGIISNPSQGQGYIDK